MYALFIHKHTHTHIYIYTYFYCIFYSFTFCGVPFLISSPEKPYFIPPPPDNMKVYPHPLLPFCPHIPLHYGIKSSRDQGPPHPFRPNKAILCYIYDWSHGSLHVYSLVGVLNSECSGWLILMLFLWNCKPLQLLRCLESKSLTLPLGML